MTIKLDRIKPELEAITVDSMDKILKGDNTAVSIDRTTERVDLCKCNIFSFEC